jgi:hypothetical protein
MANGVLIQGLSGDVSNVSVQSNLERTWALFGKKWAGFVFRRHEVRIQRDELIVLKCQGGQCVLEITALSTEHGPTILQKDVKREALHCGTSRRVRLEQGQALTLTTRDIVHPLHKQGAIIET